MLNFLKRALPFLVAGLLFTAGWHYGSQAKDSEWKEVIQNEYVTKVKARDDTQAEVNRVSEEYQANLEGLEGSTDRIISDLRNDNKRLQVRIKSTSGTLTGDGRCLVDGPVELHESTARSLIEITQKADLKEKALQDTIRKLQRKEK